MKGYLPNSSLLGKKQQTKRLNDSINSFDSDLNLNPTAKENHTGNKKLNKILKKQILYLREMRKDIDHIKCKKDKADRKLLLEKVKDIEMLVARKEEKQEFVNFKRDILTVSLKET